MLQHSLPLYKALRTQCLSYLDERHLGTALEAAEGLLSYVPCYEAQQRLLTIRENYTLLLQYFKQGAADDGRFTHWQRLLCNTYEAVDVIHRECLLSDPTHYASVYRQLHSVHPEWKMSDALSMAADYHTAFEWVMTCGQISADDEQALCRWYDAADHDSAACCAVVSGIMVGCVAQFDLRRLLLLAAWARNVRSRAGARALIGVLLLAHRYRHRLRLYPEWKVEVEMLDAEGVADDMAAIQQYFIFAAKTKEKGENLQEQFMPEIMQRLNQIKQQGTGVNLEELEQQMAEMDLQGDGATDKLTQMMQQFHGMMTQGIDVTYAQFRAVGQRASFFKSAAANWFVPFTREHPALRDVPVTPIVEQLLRLNNQSSTDAYALVFMMAKVEQMSRGIGGGLQLDLPENFGEATAEPKTREEQLAEWLKEDVHDLYRFYSLSPLRDEILVDAPFATLILLSDTAFDANLYAAGTKHYMALANSLFYERQYAECADLLSRAPTSEQTCRQLGYCHQRLGDYASAIKAYRGVLYFEENSAWTLRQLAVCYHHQRQYEEALATYERLLGLMPDDVSLLVVTAECALLVDDTARAYELLCKAYYLVPENLRVLRDMAWTCLLTRRTESACRYYAVLTAKPDVQAGDWLNAGHAALVGGDYAAAVTCYTRYREAVARDDAPRDLFDTDAATLRDLGVTDEVMRWMEDAAK